MALVAFEPAEAEVAQGPQHDGPLDWLIPVSYTHLRAHETVLDLVCRLLLEKTTHSHLHTRDM